jgi:hypothetical protein
MEEAMEGAEKGDLLEGVDAEVLACNLMAVNTGLAVQAKSGVKRELLERVVALAMKALGG